MRTQADRAARKYLRQALVDARRREVPLVLLGSYARGTSARALSDIDVLVLGDQRHDTAPDVVHVVRLSPKQLADRVHRGDDFAQWALRFGVPLTCREQWAQLADRLLGDAPWPSTERKLDQFTRRLAVAEDLLGMGDVDAAREEAGSALNLVSRAALLNAGSFPLSTPELPAQLHRIGERELAQAIDAFRSGAVTIEEDVGSLIALIRSRADGLRDAALPEPAVTTRDLSNNCRTTTDQGGWSRTQDPRGGF